MVEPPGAQELAWQLLQLAVGAPRCFVAERIKTTSTLNDLNVSQAVCGPKKTVRQQRRCCLASR